MIFKVITDEYLHQQYEINKTDKEFRSEFKTFEEYKHQIEENVQNHIDELRIGIKCDNAPDCLDYREAVAQLKEKNRFLKSK